MAHSVTSSLTGRGWIQKLIFSQADIYIDQNIRKKHFQFLLLNKLAWKKNYSRGCPCPSPLNICNSCSIVHPLCHVGSGSSPHILWLTHLSCCPLFLPSCCTIGRCYLANRWKLVEHSSQPFAIFYENVLSKAMKLCSCYPQVSAFNYHSPAKWAAGQARLWWNSLMNFLTTSL